MLVALLFAVAAQTDFGVRPVPGEAKVQRSEPARRNDPSGSFLCTVAHVTDGDTFRCTDGTRVRLSAIDTPEMPGSCRPGRTCAPGNPYAARAELVRLAGGRTVRCEPVGMSYDRVAA